MLQKAQGGGWVTPEGTWRTMMDPGAPGKGQGHLWGYSETTEVAGAQADTPGGVEGDDL